MTPDAPPAVHPHHVVVAGRRRRWPVCAFYAGDWEKNPMSGLAGTDRIDGLCGQQIRYEVVYTDGSRAGLCAPHTAHVRACADCGGPALTAVRDATDLTTT